MHGVHTASEIAPGLADHDPKPHGVHAASDVRPVLIWYFPAPHCMQVELLLAPDEPEYVPAVQF